MGKKSIITAAINEYEKELSDMLSHINYCLNSGISITIFAQAIGTTSAYFSKKMKNIQRAEFTHKEWKILKAYLKELVPKVRALNEVTK